MIIVQHRGCTMIEWFISLKFWQMLLIYWGIGIFYLALMTLFALPKGRNGSSWDSSMRLPYPFLFSRDLCSDIRNGADSGEILGVILLLIIGGLFSPILLLFELVLCLSIAVYAVMLAIVGMIWGILSLVNLAFKSIRNIIPPKRSIPAWRPVFLLCFNFDKIPVADLNYHLVFNMDGFKGIDDFLTINFDPALFD